MPNDPKAVVDQLLTELPASVTLLMQRANSVWAQAKETVAEGMPSVPLDALEEFVDKLDDVRLAYRELFAPAGAADILDTLADFADMLQVNAPGEAGIDLYVAALDTLPRVLLRRAAVALAREHKYARLPLPADFLKHVTAENSEILKRVGWVDFLQTHFLRALNVRKKG